MESGLGPGKSWKINQIVVTFLIRPWYKFRLTVIWLCFMTMWLTHTEPSRTADNDYVHYHRLLFDLVHEIQSNYSSLKFLGKVTNSYYMAQSCNFNGRPNHNRHKLSLKTHIKSHRKPLSVFCAHHVCSETDRNENQWTCKDVKWS